MNSYKSLVVGLSVNPSVVRLCKKVTFRVSAGNYNLPKRYLPTYATVLTVVTVVSVVTVVKVVTVLTKKLFIKKKNKKNSTINFFHQTKIT